MTVKDVLFDVKYDDYEIYRFKGSNHSLHTDAIERVNMPTVELYDREVLMHELMSEEDYNKSILINSDIPADFAEWYDDEKAKVLVLVIE